MEGKKKRKEEGRERDKKRHRVELEAMKLSVIQKHLCYLMECQALYWLLGGLQSNRGDR